MACVPGGKCSHLTEKASFGSAGWHVAAKLRIPLFHWQAELSRSSGVIRFLEEDIMGFGRGALLWLLGVPLPIILLLALFWHH